MTTTQERRLTVVQSANGAAVQHHSHPPAGDAQQSPTLRHQDFRTSDPEAAAQFFETAYEPGWQMIGMQSGSEMTHRRIESDSMTIDEVQLPGHVHLAARLDARTVVITPRCGSLSCGDHDEPTNEGEPLLLSVTGLPRVLKLHNATFTAISIDEAVLRSAAAELPVPLPADIRFLDRRPRSAAGTRAWHRMMDYVSATFDSPDTTRQPLIVAATARIVAAALLECFASTLDRAPGSDNEPVPALNRAVSFIHRRAMDDIGVHDIAQSVHLTPRAVQYLFRRELGATPTEYLRRVRLHRAHQDLIAGNHAVTTVAAIAAKWGFAHTGRFAVLYRQTYGQSPHETLRS